MLLNETDLREVLLPVVFAPTFKGAAIRNFFPVVMKTEPGSTVTVPKFTTAIMRDISGDVGLKGIAPEVDDGVGSATFTLARRRRKYFLPHGVEKNNQTPVNLAQRAMVKLAQSQQIHEEVAGATYMTTLANWASDQKKEPDTAWDQAGATIFKDIDGWKDDLAALHGCEANVAGATLDIFRILRYKYAESLLPSGRFRPLSVEELADAMEVEKFVVLKARHETSAAGEDATTPTLTQTWGTDRFFLARVAPEELRGETEPSYGYTFISPEESILDYEEKKDPRGTYFYLDIAYVQALTESLAGIVASSIITP